MESTYLEQQKIGHCRFFFFWVPIHTIKIRMPEKFAVNTLNFEQGGFTVE